MKSFYLFLTALFKSMQKILLKPHLFQATVNQSKDTTRRIGNLKNLGVSNDFTLYSQYRVLEDFGVLPMGSYAVFQNKKTLDYLRFKSRYSVDEVVYLAEPVYVKVPLKSVSDKTAVPYWYEYDLTEKLIAEYKKKYHRISSMFMCGFHARHFIKIKNVRCEILQDITEDQVKREGVVFVKNNGVLTFRLLFDKINKIGTWDSNPFVWVYEYEYLKDYKISDSVKK